jgi:hypothetical protein
VTPRIRKIAITKENGTPVTLLNIGTNHTSIFLRAPSLASPYQNAGEVETCEFFDLPLIGLNAAQPCSLNENDKQAIAEPKNDCNVGCFSRPMMCKTPASSSIHPTISAAGEEGKNVNQAVASLDTRRLHNHWPLPLGPSKRFHRNGAIN